jgi:putative FmdB family regulatory protein
LPIYQFKCKNDGFTREDLRRMGETYSPNCLVCNCKMDYIISNPAVILKGSGWNHGSREKLKNRSREQGKKFFKRHDDLKLKSENFKYPE